MAAAFLISSATRPVCRAIVLCLAALCLSQGAPPASAGELQVARPWRYRVFADKLPAVDDIVVRRDGSVYLTQELASGGRVARLRGGVLEVVAKDLDHPRGLVVRKTALYITEQVNEGRVVEIDLASNKRRVIESLKNPEHIAKLPDGDLAVTESSVDGRLVRLLSSGAVEVITAGLNNPQGLSVGADGTIYIGESGTGRVLAFKNGALNVVIDDLDELSQVEAGADGILWITETGNPGRLLRLQAGALEVVLTGLKNPRGVAIMEGGALLVVEQGRERILLVEPKP